MCQSTVCSRFRSSGFNPWALLDLNNSLYLLKWNVYVLNVKTGW